MQRPSSVASLLASFLAIAFASVACGTEEAPATEGTEDIVEKIGAESLYAQAETCDALIERHAGAREADMKAGTLRWDCSDVRGVRKKLPGEENLQAPEDSRGQEYCEYHAVANGQEVENAADIPAGAKLNCLFTSVYADVKGDRVATRAYGEEVAQKLASAENLGGPIPATLSIMQVGFNSRGAAAALVHDCQASAKNEPITSDKSVEARAAAAFRAVQTNNPNAAKIKELAVAATACQIGDFQMAIECKRALGDDATWTELEALGVKVAKPGEADYERQQDVAACVRVNAQNADGNAAGVPWRNSDPNICGRVARSVNECSTHYPERSDADPNGAVPDDFEGFLLTGWNGALPAGCRYMKKDGQDYSNVVICEATAQQVKKLALDPATKNDVRTFCQKTFAGGIAMQLPIRAITDNVDAAKKDTPFCSAFYGK